MSSILSPVSATSINWFECIVETTPHALAVLNASSHIVFVNRSAEALFGYPRRDLFEQPFELLIPPRLCAQARERLAQLYLEPPLPISSDAMEFVVRRQNDSEIPVLVRMRRLEDISDRFTLVSVEASKDSSDDIAFSMAALVESADDAIVTKSLDGVVRSWNPGAERLLGYRAEEIVGQSIMRLIPPDREDEERMIIDRVSRGLRVDHFETLRRRKDGALVHVSLTISPIRDRFGVISGASKIMRDTTERKRNEMELKRTNEELARINSDLEDFVYTASHDLRAPLNGVNSVVQWIMDDDLQLSGTSRDRLSLVQRRISRMKNLLNDIRDYARSDSKSKPSGPCVRAADLVNESKALLGTPVTFSIVADSSLDDVRVHQIPLQLVLNNLIENAVKHHDMPAGNVTVAVVDTGTRLRFSVTDDGPGIPDEYRESIFEMFRTLKPRDEIEGSGMGLALVRKVVRRLGGQCGIDAAGARGSMFWFDWPRITAESLE